MGFFLGATISLYVGWTMASTRRAVVLTGLQAALPPAVAVLAGSETVVWAPWSGATVGLLVLGLTLRDQDKLIAELEATRETLAEGAVAAERRRLAREVHDLAGHSVAAVLLHVTGARHLLRRDPDESERALLEAEEAGRKGMEAIRAAVTTLRTTERGDDPPLPRTSDLGHLVDGYRRAGLSIRSELSGLGQIPDGPVAVAVHRIVGEALANAARHAAGNTVDIDVDIDVDVVAADRDGETRGAGSGDGPAVRLSVVDRGRRPTSPAGHGFGLVGMAERARSLGGRLTSGPTGDGWRVDAVLPLAPTVANGADLDPDEALGIEAP
jgi:signal transduction histidine kinase